MCRFALYLGRPRTLAATLYEPPRSLSALASDPREMVRASVNVDGTGVAWWPEAGRPPLRYASARPPWSDPNLPGLAPRLTAGAHLAAVRSATPGIPFGVPAVAPFVHDGIAFAHNGWITDFRGPVGRRLLADLSDEAFTVATEMGSDSRALLGAVVTARDGAADLVGAVTAALEGVAGTIRDAGAQAALNVAVCDGDQGVVTRASVDEEHNSLYVLEDAGRFEDAAVVASEPLDPSPSWREVPPDSLVHVAGDGLRVRSLDLSSPT